MKYRNKITGAEIESPCEISGGPWEPVQTQAPTQKPVPRQTKKKTAK